MKKTFKDYLKETDIDEGRRSRKMDRVYRLTFVKDKSKNEIEMIKKFVRKFGIKMYQKLEGAVATFEFPNKEDYDKVVDHVQPHTSRKLS